MSHVFTLHSAFVILFLHCVHGFLHAVHGILHVLIWCSAWLCIVCCICCIYFNMCFVVFCVCIYGVMHLLKGILMCLHWFCMLLYGCLHVIIWCSTLLPRISDLFKLFLPAFTWFSELLHVVFCICCTSIYIYSIYESKYYADYDYYDCFYYGHIMHIIMHSMRANTM